MLPTTHIYIIYIYKEDLALNNPQELICHKTQPNQTKSVSLCHSNNDNDSLTTTTTTTTTTTIIAAGTSCGVMVNKLS